MTQTQDLDTLRAVAEGATPGPWYQAGPPWFDAASGVLVGSPDPHIGVLIIDTESWNGERDEYLENDGAWPLADPDADAKYIATFDPPTVLALLSRLDRYEKALGEIVEFVPRKEDCPADIPDAPYIVSARRMKQIARTALKALEASAPQTNRTGE